MINLKNKDIKSVYSNDIHKLNLDNYKKLGETEKFSIVFDPMFKTMIQNSERLKYSAKLFSYYLDIAYEMLLKNLTLVSDELDKMYENDKGYRSDFVAVIDDTDLNIEMNNNVSEDLMDRNVEYVYKRYSKEKIRGDKGKYRQVIQFNINSFAFEGNENIEEIYMLRDEEVKILNTKIMIIQIYLPNLVKKWYTVGTERLEEKERYLLALIEPSIDKSLELGKGMDIVEDYINEAIIASREKELLEAYDKEWALKDEAKRDGIKEGFEQGIEKGKIAGIVEGIEQNKKEIASTMLKKDMNISLISEITGLSVEEINAIKNNS